MAVLDRLEINRWDVTDCGDLINALQEAEAQVTTVYGEDAFLSWAVMRTSRDNYEANVGTVVLFSVEMTDGSFCYEVDLLA